MWRSRKLAGLSGIAVAVLMVAGCSSDVVDGPTATATPTPSPSVSRAAVPTPPAAPTAVWPLTGVDASKADPAELARPALSIKIENTVEARPQVNLDHADVVFEEYVEYGISRFIAVFHSDVPETVGPVRSMRPMDKNIMGSFAGPLIFSGAQARFVRETEATGQAVITQDNGDGGFFRVSEKRAPHNLHGRTADFFKQSTDLPAPPAPWGIVSAGDEPTSAAGKTIELIDIHMSDVAEPSWKWDGADSVWKRFEKGTPMVSKAGNQMTATNVVALWVTVKYTSAAGGSSVPETIVAKQSGTGYVASGNTQIPIKWSKAGQFDPFVFTTEAGDPVELLPGKTWVELIPNKGVANSTSINFS